MNNLNICYRLNIIDFMVMLTTVGVISLCYVNNEDQYVMMEVAAPMLMIYLSVRLFCTIVPQRSSLFFLLLLVIVCIIEICLGLLQLSGLRKSNHYLYAMTGSFNNPGPYGGFLAVCLSLFVAFIIQNKQSNKPFVIPKGLFLPIIVTSVITSIILPSTQSRSAILALGCSMMMLVLTTESLKTRVLLVIKKNGVWLILGVILLGAGAYFTKRTSADGRFFMDKICMRAFFTNGWKGAGIGHFGGSYGEAQAEYFKKKIEVNGDLDLKALNKIEYLKADCPENAFNEYLFIGVEAGPIAMLLLIVIIVYAIVLSLKNGTIWCYGVVVFSVFALFSYPLHVVQFQLLFPALLALCVSDIKEDNCKRNALIGGAVISFVFIALSITRILKQPVVDEYKRAVAIWNKTELWYSMEYYDYVIEDCEKLLPYLDNNPEYLFAYGQSLNKTGMFERSDSVLQIGIKMSSDPMFWIVMGNNSLELKKFREAEERYKNAFYMVPNRLYPLCLLAELYYKEGDTNRFLDMAESIESFVPKVESQNTERLRHKIRELKTGAINNSVRQDD